MWTPVPSIVRCEDFLVVVHIADKRVEVDITSTGSTHVFDFLNFFSFFVEHHLATTSNILHLSETQLSSDLYTRCFLFS